MARVFNKMYIVSGGVEATDTLSGYRFQSKTLLNTIPIGYTHTLFDEAIEVDYVINRFCVNAEDTKHWFTTPQTQFVMEEYSQKPFKKMLKILAAGLELKQYKQDNSDDYYSRFHDLQRIEDRSTRSATLAKCVKIVQKYEESKRRKSNVK